MIIKPNKSLVRYYSTTPDKPCKLDPLFVTGFTDGEGSFVVTVQRKTDRTIG